MIRVRAHAARCALSREERSHKSDIIARTVCYLNAVRTASSALVYLATETEVDLSPAYRAMMANGVEIAAPVIEEDGRFRPVRVMSLEDVRPGHRFGIPEPDPPNPTFAHPFDAIIVPGVAFDRRGFRLGRGEGYYDRYLERTDATLIGVAFGCQLVDVIPIEPHDVRMDIVITEDVVIGAGRCRRTPRG